jgi:halimadienyl-diphosphate synthase
LAAILALLEWGDCHRDRPAIERGLMYIWAQAERLDHEHETIGFEVILPTLLAKCRDLGLDLPWLAFERYTAMRQQKLAKIPEEMRYTRGTTLAFSFEFMGDDFELEKAWSLQEHNGSVGVSPSATAYLLTRQPGNANARRYIDQVAQAYQGRAPQVFPFDVFETAWSLWNLLLVGLVREQEPVLVQCARNLKALWDRGKGVGFSSSYSVSDADVSAIVFDLLTMAGLEPDPAPLYRFELEDCFGCYPFERNPSTSANIHVLQALKTVDRGRADKVAKWLRRVQVEGGFWTAKWHASPYYPTAHAVMALIGVDQDLARSAVEWILDTQQSDGGWGYYGVPTAEETAYCLQALSVYDHIVKPVGRSVLDRGGESLLARMHTMPALWIGKCLYTPVRVVESAICSALAMFGP